MKDDEFEKAEFIMCLVFRVWYEIESAIPIS